MPTREDRLLATCARLNLDDARRDQVRATVRSGVDWQEVLTGADRHGLVPLLHLHLSSIADSIPRDVLVDLWAAHEHASRRNCAMALELAAITEVLERHGIASVAFKGPTLALQAYGDLALRQFGDLDLIVKPRDVAAARRALSARGYDAQTPLTAEQEQALVTTGLRYELPLVDPARGLIVELHWRTDPDVSFLPLDDESWWRSRPTIECGGRRVNVLAPDELLLALCLHGTKHFWSQLGWLVDVAELLRKAGPGDVDAMLARSREHGCLRRVALGPTLARELLDAPIPDALAKLGDDTVVSEIATSIARDMFDPASTTPGIRDALKLNLRLRDTAAQRLAYAWTAAVTPGWGEWQRWRLPRPFFFLYWLLRPVRLAEKYVFNRRSPQTPAAATPRTPPPQPRSTG